MMIKSDPTIPVLNEDACCTTECSPECLPIVESKAAEWAGVLKALGNPVRLQMMAILARQNGQICVCDLEAFFTLTQPTISHHLKVLRDAGLITSEQRGLWVYHSIQPHYLASLNALMKELTPA